MSLRSALPTAGPLAVVVLGGLVAGVLLGKARPPSAAPPPAPPAPAAPGPAAPPAPRPPDAPPPAFRIPGAPPPEIAREMEEALRGTFEGDPSDPAVVRARDAAFARVEALTARWAAASGRHPLAAAAWWRAALARTLSPRAPAPAGWAAEEVPFLGERIPFRVSTPPAAAAGAPVPGILAFVDAVLDPEALLRDHYGPLLSTHAVVAVLLRHPRQEEDDPVVRDPRTALLALSRAAGGRAIDRDRVVLDGFGRGSGLASLLAADGPRHFQGAILRSPTAVGEPAENLASLPLLVPGPAEPAGPMAAAFAAIRAAAPGARFLPSGDFAEAYLSEAGAIREWIAALPPRAAADPRRPFAFASVTGDRFLTFGQHFVVRRTPGFGPGRTVRVRVSRDPARNAVVLDTEEASEILLLLSDEGLDLDRPVTVIANGRVLGERKVERSLAVLRAWASTGDRALLATAEWTVRIDE